MAIGHVVAYAHHGSEGVGTKAQMCILAHVLEALSFFLHRIVAGAETVNLNLTALQLYRLSCSLALNQLAVDIDA